MLNRVWPTLTLGQKLLALFIPPLLIAVVTVLLVAHALQREIVTHKQVLGHADSIELRQRLIKAAVDAETGLRGFTLTGNTAYLKPYHEAVQEFPLIIASLTQVELDTPGDLHQATRINQLFGQWRETVAEPRIELREQAPVGLAAAAEEFNVRLSQLLRLPPRGKRWREATTGASSSLDRLLALDMPATFRVPWQQLRANFGTYREAPSLTRLHHLLTAADALTRAARNAEQEIFRKTPSGSGKALMDQMRALSAAGLAQERRELNAMLATDDAKVEHAEYAAIAGPLVAILLSGLFLAIMFRRILRELADMSDAAQTIASGDYTRRIGSKRQDELGQLARAMDTMAAELAARRSEQQASTRFSEILQTCVHLPEAYDATQRFCSELFPGTSGALYMIASSRNLMERVVEWGNAQHPNTVFRPEDCRALRAGHPYLMRGRGDMPCAHLPEELPAASLCVPLVGQDETLGILTIYVTDPADNRHIFSHQNLAFAVSEQLMLSLGNLRLRDRLRQQSIRDPLTGLYNRRYFEETLQRELLRATRQNQPVSLIMLDVDHFKRFNDNHGHEAGDQVLRAVADVLKQAVRGEDVACRFGGEEFLLLLIATPLATAVARAEEVRQAVQTLQVEYGSGELDRISISAGVASVPEHADSAAALTKFADQALYRAKQTGRNRVVAAA